MWGGGGKDVFVFKPGETHPEIEHNIVRHFTGDIIYDFESGDRIDLSAFVNPLRDNSYDVKDFSDLNISQVNGDTVIRFGDKWGNGGDTLRLKGVNASDLSAEDFIFNGDPDAEYDGFFGW